MTQSKSDLKAFTYVSSLNGYLGGKQGWVSRFGQLKFGLCISSVASIYSRTSMARTLMARLPRLFRTRS